MIIRQESGRIGNLKKERLISGNEGYPVCVSCIGMQCGSGIAEKPTSVVFFQCCNL